MYISARERKIIELLVLKHDEMTVKDLSDELEVSPRTVHRDLKGVEDILVQYGLSLNKKTGTGIKIVGDAENKEKLELFLLNISHNEYTSEERQTIILSSLLDTAEPVKLVSLANDLNVTIATISNDLNKVEEQITPYGLSLLRKRGYGVEIVGTESAKRKVMSKLIMNNLDEFEFMSIIKENIQKKSARTMDTITNRLLGLVDEKKLLIIEKHIDEIKKDLPYTIADSAYIGLVVHLALAIERIQQGEEINFDDTVLEKLKHTKEFEAAKKIVSRLEAVLGISISYGEIGYITMHLMGAKLRIDQKNFLEDTDLHDVIYVQNLIQFVSNKIGEDLTSNFSLFKDLLAHLRPALYRIKQNMGISNPLLAKIKNDYQDLFTIIEEGVAATFSELNVPKEEIGYLVMHFASALLNRDVINEVKALVVCSSGIGTSKILSTRLEQEIPGLKTRNISLFELDTIDNYEYDIIVSTIPLKNFNEEYTLVSPLLSQKEVGEVKRSLVNQHNIARKIVRTEPVKRNTTTINHNQFLLKLEKAMLYSTSIYQLIQGFSVSHIEEQNGIEQILLNACESLQVENVISDSDEVMKSLLQREEIGGLGIPGTTLALYHTKSESIIAPSFTIYRLTKPIIVKAMDGSNLEVNTILLMLSPMNANEEMLEILSEISSIIIRDEDTVKKFQTDTEKNLLYFITAELKTIYELKTSVE